MELHHSMYYNNYIMYFQIQ